MSSTSPTPRNDALKQCPFCGSRAVELDSEPLASSAQWAAWVLCLDCRSQCGAQKRDGKKNAEHAAHTVWNELMYAGVVQSESTSIRDGIIEECARELDRQVQHINENATSLRKFPGEDQEARARELGAMHVAEAANSLRQMKSDSPMMKLLEKL